MAQRIGPGVFIETLVAYLRNLAHVEDGSFRFQHPNIFFSLLNGVFPRGGFFNRKLIRLENENSRLESCPSRASMRSQNLKLKNLELKKLLSGASAATYQG